MLGYLETFALVTGIACMYLATKGSIWNWPVGLASIISFIYIFYCYQLYAQVALQVYFLGNFIYGWYYWSKHNERKDVVVLTPKTLLYIALITAFIGGVSGILLSLYTNSDVPYVDGFCTIGSIVAQILLSRKVLQNWLFWIVADSIFIPLFLYKGLYQTALLYGLYLYLGIKGYLDWKNELAVDEEDSYSRS